MKTVVRAIGLLALSVVIAVLAYSLQGYLSARADVALLSRRADALIAHHRGPEDLGSGRIQQLLMVEDPGFWTHDGTDWSTPGSGLTTLTQSLGKRVGFKNFHPGLQKIRLVGYAKGLASTLSKRQILALYLDTVWMGRGPNGSMTGLFSASEAVFHRPPSALSEHQFLSLVAVLIAPRKFNLTSPNSDLEERTARIERLVSKQCQPTGLRDVWLEGCASTSRAGQS
jgi:membrane carboxypeptidase/penicillin-binding protein PbpC